MHVARALWQRVESVHAVTYFAPEPLAAAKAAGLRGFWMGYFGCRAAPMGSVSAGVVQATFANFAPSMVERSIPDAWNHASPADLIEVRAEAAAAALRRLSPTSAADDHAPLDESIRTLEILVAHGEALGRPLFAANAGLDHRSDRVERLWQACTTLREHRGDGHVIALASHDIDGCEAHRLHAAAHGTPHEILRDNRGFDQSAWQAAADRLRTRGLLDGDDLTGDGLRLVRSVEAATDDAAVAPIEASGIDMGPLIEHLTVIANEIGASGVLPFPNPMGLPRL